MSREELSKEKKFLKRNFPEVWKRLQELPASQRARKTHKQYCFYKNPLRDGLKIHEVSKMFNVPRRTLQHWVKQYAILTIRESPYRIPESEFEKIKAEHERILDARREIRELKGKGLKINSAYVHRSREKKKQKKRGKD